MGIAKNGAILGIYSKPDSWPQLELRSKRAFTMIQMVGVYHAEGVIRHVAEPKDRVREHGPCGEGLGRERQHRQALGR